MRAKMSSELVKNCKVDLCESAVIPTAWIVYHMTWTEIDDWPEFHPDRSKAVGTLCFGP